MTEAEYHEKQRKQSDRRLGPITRLLAEGKGSKEIATALGISRVRASHMIARVQCLKRIREAQDARRRKREAAIETTCTIFIHRGVVPLGVPKTEVVIYSYVTPEATR